MENHHRHKTSSSGDNFTFPAMPPGIEIDSELADHLFSNGKFLLHSFPLQPKSLTSCTTLSRTSSVSSKDSLVSSRSTSTNSRSSNSSSSSSSSSSCTSARTSTSEPSTTLVPTRTTILPGSGSPSPVHFHYNNNYHLQAQRWQFMAPVPVLNRRTSSRRKADHEKQKGSPERKKHDKRKGYCRRFFRWLVSTCKECHAMEPSKKVF